jgi:hypothetical protein
MAACVLAALAAAAIPGPSARALAQDDPKPPAPAPKPAEGPAPAPAQDEAKVRKEGKVRKLLELARFKDTVIAGIEASFDMQRRMGMKVPRVLLKKLKEVADFKALEQIAVDAYMENFDEETLDGAIVFLGTEPGRKYAEAGLRLLGTINAKTAPWAREAAEKAVKEIREMKEEDAGEDADEVRELHAAMVAPAEASAIATLRNLASGQAQVQTAGFIDCDNDGIGEYGTFLELAGAAAVRSGFEAPEAGGARSGGSSDFSKQGKKVQPPLVSPAMGKVDAEGTVTRNGYRFRIYLPDTGKPAGFVHETGPAEKVGLAGGTVKVCVDLSETTWCAYAWPEKVGSTGNRVFFVNQAGDVLQSANGRTKWGGDRTPPPDAAFRGAGITAEPALGTLGRDGETWKVVN